MKIFKITIIFIILLFSLFFSYLSYFFYDVVIWNVLQWTYSTYSIWKELLINTDETKDNIVWTIKSWILELTDKEKAEELKKENNLQRQQNIQDEVERKEKQNNVKNMLSIIPYFLSFLTFVFIIKFLLNLLVSLINVNKEILEWFRSN